MFAKKVILILVLIFAFVTVSPLFAKPVMYVVTGDSNELIMVDLNTNRIVGRIGELENAHGLSGHPRSEYLVAGSMSSGQTKVPGKPTAVSKEEHEAHHSISTNSGVKEQKSAVSIVHPKHGHVMRRVTVAGITHHTAVAPNGRWAAAVHTQIGKVSIIDLEAMNVTQTIKVGQVPNYAVIDEDGKTIYVSNAGSGNVSVIQTNHWMVTNTIKVGMGPEHMAISSDGQALFVLNVVEGSVSVVDLASARSIRTIKVGKSPHGISPSSDGHWLFVSNKGSNSVTRISLNDYTATTVPLSPAPYHLEYVTSVDRVYVSSRKKPLIWVLDPETLKVISQIEFKKGVAHQMVVMEE